MRLLVVEDDVAIQGFLKRALVESGYQVDTANNAKTGELKALEGIHDAFIIDLGLPDMDGLDLIVRCRAQGISAPVLILSARRSVDERVRGLEQGGDDYLTKPFALAELLARLRNLLRRSSPPQNDSVRLQAADLQLDLVRHEARRGDHLLQLTPQEFSLLEYLCRNAGRVVTRTMILDHVWRMRIDPVNECSRCPHLSPAQQGGPQYSRTPNPHHPRRRIRSQACLSSYSQQRLGAFRSGQRWRLLSEPVWRSRSFTSSSRTLFKSAVMRGLAVKRRFLLESRPILPRIICTTESLEK